MRKLLFLFLLLAPAANATTYYISITGSNANNGTSTSTPWKSHPFMRNDAGCGGALPTYSHSAGDRFIFKGGDAWPAACFEMTVTLGGSSTSVRDYYGVDLTWFTGGSWTHPKFDMANATPTNNGCNGAGTSHAVVCVYSTSYTEWDNIEILRMFVVGPAGNVGVTSGIGFLAVSGSCTGHIVHNMYIHGWVNDTTNMNLGFNNGSGGLGASGCGYTVYDSEITDQDNVTTVPFGGCFSNATGAYRNHCHHAAQGAVNFFGEGVHDNEIDHITDSCCRAGGAYTNGIHTNGIEGLIGSANVPVYNNLLHDNLAGINMNICSAARVYNNVMWNNHEPEIDMYADNNSFCPNPSSNTANVYNNTIVCSTGGAGACVRVHSATGASLGTLNVKNNHFITSSPTPVSSGVPVGSTNISTNTTMTASTAAGQGYTTGNDYQPTSGTNGTVNQGANLTSLCGTLTALCTDAKANPFIAGSGTARPPTGAWDTGAYRFNGVPLTPPLPPTGVTATPH